MKKGQTYEGVVEKIDFPNVGQVRVDGEASLVQIKNVLPGQRVRFVVNKFRNGQAKGRLLEVVEKSPWETREKVCNIFPSCGGCLYQTFDYEKQLEIKEQQVKETLDKAIDYVYDFAKILPAPSEFQYRNKMEFSFGDDRKDGPLTLGLHKRASTYDILTADDCQLVHEDMTKVLACILVFFRERNIPYYKKMSHEGILRHLVLRRGERTGELLVNLVTTSQTILPITAQEVPYEQQRKVPLQVKKEEVTRKQMEIIEQRQGIQRIQQLDMDLSSLVEDLRNLDLEGEIVGITHIINDSLSDVVKCDELRLLYGRDFLYDRLFALQFKISPFSFFQPNTKGAELIYTKVKEYLGDVKDKVIYDLFSGTGTISQVLASEAKAVIGVEIVAEAVEAAKENAKLNGLQNCYFIAGDVLEVLDTLTSIPDVIVLDPPRDGIHPKALPKVIALNCPKIVYVSCKVTSLARDLVALHQAGYRVEKATCIDQFAQTAHVEAVVLLARVEALSSRF